MYHWGRNRSVQIKLMGRNISHCQLTQTNMSNWPQQYYHCYNTTPQKYFKEEISTFSAIFWVIKQIEEWCLIQKTNKKEMNNEEKNITKVWIWNLKDVWDTFLNDVKENGDDIPIR